VGNKLKLNKPAPAIGSMKDFQAVPKKVLSFTNPGRERAEEEYILLEIEEQKLFLSDNEA